MSVLTNGTWVLVADGEKALFLRNLTDEQDPNLEVVRQEAQENPPTREQGTDRAGRMQDTGVQQLSAMEETDWHRLEEERFADDLADLLYKMAHEHKFERIVLCAPPRVLGELRQKMHKEVESRVVGEVAKELTKHPRDEIENILSKELDG
ncbi:Host attachment protein [Rhodosalinus halophilus]|jgi:protein required for attachment to host cells|uniref:Host attachment protein n=1 Tax=Rhodosalinus halophilus TaxID=2259333 RepID=A0A365U4S7_9RHOB|nr:host attachment family protein [Rhodosalinus halophilus]RBI83251.1 Host attachment protein [Rhodosalinus halophilus]